MRLAAIVANRRAAIVCLAALAGAGALPVCAQRRAENPQVLFNIEKRGAIRVELLQADAPKTTAHFLSLVKSKFYDGVLFHRLEVHFVAQAGDPKSKSIDGSKLAGITSDEAARRYGLGMGGSGKTIPLEATVPHMRGTLGLARSAPPDSGDSQVFFNLADNHNLDNLYCAFGRIVSGMDVMDAIRQGDRIKSIRVAPRSGSTARSTQ